jgi:hypothetical protein
MPTVEYDECQGWPAVVTRVTHDRTVIHSAPMNAADRDVERLRVHRYRVRIRKAKQRCRDQLRQA